LGNRQSRKNIFNACTIGVQDHLQPTSEIRMTAARVSSLTLITAAEIKTEASF
jgi:hypothetical protein